LYVYVYMCIDDMNIYVCIFVYIHI
jgi:hypothetical protein